jgi:DNA-binding Xre family transcriptional regulator
MGRDTLSGRAMVKRMVAVNNLAENLHYRADKGEFDDAMFNVVMESKMNVSRLRDLAQGYGHDVTLDELANIAVALKCSISTLLGDYPYGDS